MMSRYEEAAAKYSEALDLMPEIDPDDDDEIEAGKGVCVRPPCASSFYSKPVFWIFGMQGSGRFKHFALHVCMTLLTYSRDPCVHTNLATLARGTPDAKLRAILLSNRAQVLCFLQHCTGSCL